MFLLPTKRNIDKVRRFFSAARETGMSLPGMVLVNEDEFVELQSEYDDIQMPGNWAIVPVKAKCLGDALRFIWPKIKDREWVGLIADDHIPMSLNWDTALLSKINGWNFVSSNDGWQAPNRIHGATIWSGDVLRAVGWLFPPKLKHLFHDDIWETIGRESNAWACHMDIMVRHAHESLEGIVTDKVDPTSPLWKHDEKVFLDWKGKDLARCVDAVRSVQEKRGVTVLRPEFGNVHLMVGTPCMDGKYERGYVVSLFHTMRMINDAGGRVDWAEELYNADITLARAKIFATFLRSPCTHLLMIDADMDWTNDAVVRLFAANKDMVAVAGPKKRYPLQFAANYADDRGNGIPLEFDMATGTAEVHQVGMAFCLITRACAEKMAKGYPELTFRGIGDEPEYALFTPIIVNPGKRGRYMAEDFAFCHRWRELGGKVYICPDVPLGHTGAHRFSGALSQTWVRNETLLEAAE